MQRRFRLRQAPIQPLAQPSAELARRFIFASFALTEEFDSALQLCGSGGRSFKLPDEGQQLLQLVIVQFIYEPMVFRALVLEGDLVSLTICLSARIHTASPFLSPNLITIGTL
jgi:hypothetical protein